MFQKNSRVKTGEDAIYAREKWLIRGENEPLARHEHLAREVEDLLAHDIEARLSAYYGPALPPHPLQADAWLRLNAQLGAQARPRRRRVPSLGRSFARPAVPVEIQHLYATLLLQANYQRPAPELRVRFPTRARQPRVQAGVLGHGHVSLLLPGKNWQDLQREELDILLAAGLARCGGVSRSLLLLARALFAVSLLLVLAALPFSSVDRRVLWLCLAACVCCLVSGRVLIWQERALAFRADRVAVAWLGHERVCQGLHLLAEHGNARRRPTWVEPSLAERIARVCNTPVAPNRDKRLTMVG